MTYRYLVGFIDTPTGYAAGASVNRNQPIRDMDDVEEIRAELIRQGYRNPVVLSFARFEEDQ